MKIKRYLPMLILPSHQGYAGTVSMSECADGDYVSYHDYALLQAREAAYKIRIGDLDNEKRELVSDLHPYLRHMKSCANVQKSRGLCNCGLDDLLAKVNKP